VQLNLAFLDLPVIAGFAHQTDAELFLAAMSERLRRFALTLRPAGGLAPATACADTLGAARRGGTQRGGQDPRTPLRPHPRSSPGRRAP
jgi:hypothetical protein